MSSLLKQLTLAAGGEDLGQFIRYYDTGTNISAPSSFASTSDGDFRLTFAYESNNTIYAAQVDEDGNFNWHKQISITESNTPSFNGVDVYVVTGNYNVTAVVMRVDGQHDDTQVIFLNPSNGSVTAQRLFQSWGGYSSADVRLYSRAHWNANRLSMAGVAGNLKGVAAVDDDGSLDAEWNLGAFDQITGVGGWVSTTYIFGKARATTWDDLGNDSCQLVKSQNNIGYRVLYHRGNGYLARLNPVNVGGSPGLFVYGSFIYFLAAGQGGAISLCKVYTSNGTKVWFKDISNVQTVYGMTVTSSGPLLNVRTASDSKYLLVQIDHNGDVTWKKDIGGVMRTLTVTADGNWIDGLSAYDGRNDGGYYTNFAWRRLQNPPADEITGVYTVQDYSGTLSTSNNTDIIVDTSPDYAYSGNTYQGSDPNYTTTASGVSVSDVTGMQGIATGYDGSIVQFP